MARPDSWMPLHIEPWTKKTARLNAAERGTYMDLLLAYWIGGPLPANDEETLKRLARCTDKEWKAVRAKVMGFFKQDGELLRNPRADEEKADAAQRYERRASAGKAGGIAKSKQTPKQNSSNATADDQAKPQASNILHSVVPEKTSTDVLGAARRQPKRATSLSPDWTPSQQDQDHAADKGLDAQTIRAVAEHFRDDNIAKGRTSKDWSASWRTWIAKHIGWNGTGTWPRADGKRPAGNVPSRASNATAFDQIRAEAGIEQRGGHDSSLRTEGGAWSSGIDHGATGFGPIIAADYYERSVGLAGGTEGAHAPDGGADDERRDDADQSIPEAASGLPSGRGEACAENPSDIQPLVASMAGTSRAVGDTHLSQTDDAGGTEARNLD